MSGHSKWSTIKRKKESNDQARGKLFSKLSKAISVAVKTGGGPNIDSNYKLKMVVDQAKSANMPKDNIDRAIARASGEDDNLDEMVYEGFGPGGVQVIVDATTDNKNRTAQELKFLFDRNGGSMGGPNSVAFNFELKGYMLVNNGSPMDAQMLALIDLGVEDVEEGEGGVEVYVNARELMETKDKLQSAGYEILQTELMRKPVSKVKVDTAGDVKKVLRLMELLEEHEDVSSVNSNADIDDQFLQ